MKEGSEGREPHDGKHGAVDGHDFGEHPHPRLAGFVNNKKVPGWAGIKNSDVIG